MILTKNRRKRNESLHKFTGQHCLPYIVLAGLTLFFCYLFYLQQGVFGGKVDWISQHSVLPDYFRMQFYATGKLFPEFAPHLGAGQNIYHFSYYGLYSPLFLLSYALPFVKMSDYVIVMQIVVLISAVCLMYRWLKTRVIETSICFGVSLFLLLAGPVMFHACHQIMFVNYLPFLILGVMGVDRYFEKRKGGLLVLSIFLMIMTSFYFSIGGMLVLVLYGIYNEIKILAQSGKKLTVKRFLLDGLNFCIPFLIAVCISGILLVPTAFALMERKSTAKYSDAAGGILHILKQFLLPRVHLAEFLYSPYGIGVTTLGITVLFAYMFAKRTGFHAPGKLSCAEKVLAWEMAVVLFVPAFLYLLNGGLYLRDKAFIPFLVPLCYLIACYLQTLNGLSFSLIGCIPYLFTIGFIILGKDQMKKDWRFALADGGILLLCYLVTKYRKSTVQFIMLSCAFLLIFDFRYSIKHGELLDQAFYNCVTEEKIKNQMLEITERDPSLYRTTQLGTTTENAANLNRIWSEGQYSTSMYSSAYASGYDTFRRKTFRVEQPFRNFLMQSAEWNPVFQRMMGEKYILSSKKIPGYTCVKEENKEEKHQSEETGQTNKHWTIYKNELAAPVIYGTDQLLSEAAYRKLEFPYNQTAFLSYGIIGNGAVNDPTATNQETAKTVLSGQVTKVPFSPDVSNTKLKIRKTGQGIRVQSSKNLSVNCSLPEEITEDNRIFFLQFEVVNLNPPEDLSVWVNQSKNKLTSRDHIYYNDNTTFTYAIALQKHDKHVKLTLGKGSYEILNPKAYIGTMPGTSLYQSEFQMDQMATKGNVIQGTIDIADNGYLITSIPYDPGFEIRIDDTKVPTETVNTAFLGCKLKAGEHKVQLIYHAPGLREGKLLSLIGILMLGCYGYVQKYSEKKKRKIMGKG